MRAKDDRNSIPRSPGLSRLIPAYRPRNPSITNLYDSIYWSGFF